jgi:hypothetical protein
VLKFSKYGLDWNAGTSPLEIEKVMIRSGGQWIGKQGQTLGNGLFFHFKEFEKLLWPTAKVWHKWSDLQLKEWLSHRTVGIIGPASSGKTCNSATDSLADYYAFPECTTILVCSTTKERMQDRIFGEIKKYHRLARERYPDLPGYSIDGRMRIVTESKDDARDGRDFRSGFCGVPCLSGGEFKGISEFIGIKNKRLRVVIDELQMLPPSVLMAISNLDKNDDFKLIGMGNPKETTDALGMLCEPSYELGGWDGGIDQTPKTKVWDTRRPDGVCIQLVGSESPNLDGSLGIPLITQEAMDRDIAQYGKDSLQFTMMNQGMMPRGQGSRRVLTRQLCLKNKAMDEPEWASSERTKVGFLDAAFGGVGGDRCIFGELQFGYAAATLDPAELDVSLLVSQKPSKSTHKQILALIDYLLVPINVMNTTASPEEQIVNFVREQCSTRNIPPQNFFFDSGMRGSLVSMFGRLWSPQTNPIDCGGSPSDRMVSNKIQVMAKNYYQKFITEMWFRIRLIVEAGQFRGMKDTALQEFCAREWRMVGANKIEVEPKSDMKDKTGRSPDIADAIAVGCEGAVRLGFKIDSPVNREYEHQTMKWKTELRSKAKLGWSEKALSYS